MGSTESGIHRNTVLNKRGPTSASFFRLTPPRGRLLVSLDRLLPCLGVVDNRRHVAKLEDLGLGECGRRVVDR